MHLQQYWCQQANTARVTKLSACCMKVQPVQESQPDIVAFGSEVESDCNQLFLHTGTQGRYLGQWAAE